MLSHFVKDSLTQGATYSPSFKRSKLGHKIGFLSALLLKVYKFRMPFWLIVLFSSSGKKISTKAGAQKLLEISY